MTPPTPSHIVAIVSAGGQGTRVGKILNKVFLPLAGKPLVAWAIDSFQTHPLIQEVVLVLHSRDRELLGTPAIDNWSPSEDVRVVDGGTQRQESVLNGLLASTVDDEDLALVHDGARPIVTTQEIQDVIEAAHLGCGALLTIPVQETIKRIDREERVVATPERARYRIARTPQAFRRGDLIRALKNTLERGLKVTDCSSCIEALRRCPRCESKLVTFEDAGQFEIRCSRWPVCPEQTPVPSEDILSTRRRLEAPIRCVEGRVENIKITYPQDLQQAEFLLARLRGEG